MSEYLVVASNSSRARFFQLKDADNPDLQSSPNLIEAEPLDNPQKELHESKVFSDHESGVSCAAGGGSWYEYDDHRERHVREFDRRFAKQVAERALADASASGTRCLILIANPKMLGHLRPEIRSRLKTDIQLQELPREVTKLSALELHKLLSSQDFLPKRKPPQCVPKID